MAAVTEEQAIQAMADVYSRWLSENSNVELEEAA